MIELNFKYEAEAFAQSGYRLVVWYHGRQSVDTISSEVCHPAHAAYLAEDMLRELVEAELGLE
jgi:hypothetical protein